MSWEVRGGKRCYYRAKRVNGRVVKEYCGTGPEAEAAAKADADASRAAFAARYKVAQQLHEFKQFVAEIHRLDDLMAAEIARHMVALGYHKYRGVWRLKRKPKEAKEADAPGGAC